MSMDLAMSYDDMGPREVAKKHYPSFHYEGPEKLDLPKEGVMTIRFKKSGQSSSESEDGKERHSCTVEVLSIEDVDDKEVESPSKRKTNTEDVLDGLMKEKMAKKNKDY